jgi:hypothetical protein
MGDVSDGEIDPFSQNFKNLFTGSYILFALISFEGYPECMYPYIEISSFYSLFFIFYIMLLILVFVPVPVAVVYDAFKVIKKKKKIFKKNNNYYFFFYFPICRFKEVN